MPWISRAELDKKNAELESLREENASLKDEDGNATRIGEMESALEAMDSDLKAEKKAHEVTSGKLASADIALAEARSPQVVAASVVAALTPPEKKEEADAHAEANKPILDAVQAEVSRQVAATGRPPVNIETERSCETATISRAEFNALSPAKRNAFMRKGGKLKD